MFANGRSVLGLGFLGKQAEVLPQPCSSRFRHALRNTHFPPGMAPCCQGRWGICSWMCPWLFLGHMRGFQPGSCLFLGQEPGQGWREPGCAAGQPEPFLALRKRSELSDGAVPAKGPCCDKSALSSSQLCYFRRIN